MQDDSTVRFCEATRAGKGMRSVRLESIVRYAAAARAILRIGQALHDGRLPGDEDWALVQPWAFVFDTPGSSLQSARMPSAVVVDNWLRDADARIRFAWEGDEGPLLRIGDGETTVTIAMEVAHALMGGAHATCSGCARVYRREERRASPTRMNFCDECRRDGTAERLRKARQRERARLRGSAKAR